MSTLEYTIRIGQQPVLLDDADGTIAKWLSSKLDTLGLPVTAAPRQSPWVPREWAWPETEHPLPQYGTLPPWRLNVLVWPTGATRWAYGLFLVTEKMLKAIRDESTSTALRRLTVHYKEREVICVDMVPLSPIPVSEAAGWHVDADKAKDADGNLLLLPLVCRRWLSANRSCDRLETLGEKYEWDELLDYCSTLLDPSEIPTLHDAGEDYQWPDPAQTGYRWPTEAALIDAICASTGGQAVTYPYLEADARGWESTQPTDAGYKVYRARWQKHNLIEFGLPDHKENPLIAGAHPENPSVLDYQWLPETIRVVFPRYEWGARCRDWHVKDYTLAELGIDTTFTIPGTIRDVFTTAHADFSGGGVDPVNETEVDDLALLLATDAAVRWSVQPIVQVRAGIYRIEHAPPDTDADTPDLHLAKADRVEFHLGRECFTRWVGLPANCGAIVNLSQFADKPLYYSPCNILFTTPDEEAGYNANLVDLPNNKDNGTTYRLNVTGAFIDAEVGSPGIAYWNVANQRWELLNRGC